MKQTYTLLLFIFLIANSTFAQVNTTSGSWSAIGDVLFPLPIITSDGDNGDGVGDGALAVNGQSSVMGQGAAYTFGGTMQTGKLITISTFTFNTTLSFVSFKIELWRKNNSTYTSLATSSPTISFANKSTPAINTVLTYTPKAADAGGELQVRYIRTDDGNKLRAFAIDNLTLLDNITIGGPCPFTTTLDLQLLPSNTTIDNQIKGAVAKFSDSYLGTSAPSGTNVTAAENSYNALNITVNGSTITGKPVTSFQGLTFLKTFAQYLKFNPTDPKGIGVKANNTIWWVSKQFCDGGGGIPTNSPFKIDTQLYDYEDFARPASLIKDFLDSEVKNLFAYTLYQHSVQFEHFWAPVYDSAYQQVNGAIITDVVYNIGDVLLAYSLWQDSADERYRYMRAYKRYMDRYFTYTVGTNDGLKPDGSGFHHWVAYNNYMYSFNTAASILSYLNTTPFQVEAPNYKVFRDAFYAQFIQANDAGVQALATAGRNPQSRSNTLSKSALKTLAIAGGDILGLTTADPLLAGMYNRIYGVDTAFRFNTVTPFESGFFQFNHAMAGAFRKGGTVVFNKGFSNNMFGTEAYTNQNRYGRYQSYGALEVIYPGDRTVGNGYDFTSSWDWNFNPGTTVIKLTFDKLHAEWSRLDEQQQKRFVGSLSLKNKNSELLTNNHGDFGMFAMDFQEDANQGFGTNYSSNAKNHNSSFTFKKSNFFFDDIIVCLGSGISNNDSSNETVTTLFQRLDNKVGVFVNVNGVNQQSGTTTYLGGTLKNSLVSNYGTGFYLVAGNDNVVVKKENQQTPNQNQTWPVTLTTTTNPIKTYYTGYINHGKNPSGKSYEYILKPNSNTSEMQALDLAIQAGNKPYTVRQKDANAHIVEHIAKKIFGYAIFNSVSGLTYNNLKAVNGSCLVMTQFNSSNNTLLLSIDNPDIGFTSKTNTPSNEVTRQITLLGEWTLSGSYPGVTINSANANETMITFSLKDGLAKEVVLNSLSLSNKEFEKLEITIFPNPAKDVVTISGIENNTLNKVSIVSMLGQNIKIFESPSNKIDISNVQDGIYFIKINLNDNKVITKKLIIKR